MAGYTKLQDSGISTIDDLEKAGNLIYHRHHHKTII